MKLLRFVIVEDACLALPSWLAGPLDQFAALLPDRPVSDLTHA
jgi:hypothetical protein